MGGYNEMDEEQGIREVKTWPRPLYLMFGALLFVLVAGGIIFAFVSFTDDDSDKQSSWQGTPSKYSNAAVAAESETCSQMGKDILLLGGNAVEAAITTDICVGIMHCFATNVGGGGVMIVRKPNGKVEILDFREAAPAASTYDMYSSNEWSSLEGPLASGVPGSFKGYSEAYKKYSSGEVTWEQLITPAAELAANFPVDSFLAKNLVEKENYIMADPGLSSVFAPNGVLLTEGENCQWTSLSTTLIAISKDETVDVFYNGVLGENLIADMKEIDSDSIMTTQDLSDYTVVERDPVVSFYRGFEVFGAPPPFTGGAIVAQGLNIIEQYNFPLMGDGPLTQHYLIQSMLFGYADRTGMGDPANPYNVNMMTDIIDVMATKTHAATLRPKISDNTTYPVDHYFDLTQPASVVEDHGTSHFSVVDDKGYSVGLTSTINWGFGAKYMSPSTGLIMNNEMDDFSTPGRDNGFGYPPSESNYPGPGLRPASSMTPTIITKNEDVLFVGGASGGSRIISATYQTIVNFMDLNWNLYDAVNRPRLHDQWMPDEVNFETGYPSSWMEELGSSFGYNTSQVEGASFGVVQSIARQDDGTWLAACDRRKNGSPAGY